MSTGQNIDEFCLPCFAISRSESKYPFCLPLSPYDFWRSPVIIFANRGHVGQLNMFLQHWEMSHPIGQMLCMSMEILQLEAGCSGCPLSKHFHPMGPLTTHFWIRLPWECVSIFKIHIEVDYPVLPFLQEND